jgi:hypothetical protein
MSLQTAVQHLASAAGAFLSVQMLVTRPDQSLEGMSAIAVLSIVLSVVVLLPVYLVESGVQRREAASASA